MSTSMQPMASVEDMITALDALVPEADAVAALRFAELFPAIVKAKQRAATKQQILTLLAEMGLTLHPRKFDALYNAEMELRNNLGERYCCIACGQPLRAKDHSRAKESLTLTDGTGTNAGVSV